MKALFKFMVFGFFGTFSLFVILSCSSRWEQSSLGSYVVDQLDGVSKTQQVEKKKLMKILN